MSKTYWFVKSVLSFRWNQLEDRSEVKVAQSCVTLCDPHGILQARVLEWVAFPFFRGSSQPSDGTQVAHIAGRFFTHWTMREAHSLETKIQRADSFEETLMLEKIEGGRRRRQQRVRCLDAITDSMDMSLSRLRELVMNREAWHAAVHEVKRSGTQLSNWTELKV